MCVRMPLCLLLGWPISQVNLKTLNSLISSVKGM